MAPQDGSLCLCFVFEQGLGGVGQCKHVACPSATLKSGNKIDIQLNVGLNCPIGKFRQMYLFVNPTPQLK